MQRLDFGIAGALALAQQAAGRPDPHLADRARAGGLQHIFSQKIDRAIGARLQHAQAPGRQRADLVDRLLDAGGIKIGDNVLLAPNGGLYTVGHPLDVGLRNQAWEDAKPIVIGDNVWIGAGCTIVGGVCIGDNAVIAAGSVVTKNIPADMLAMGVPCRPVRKITEADRAAYQVRIDEENV